MAKESPDRSTLNTDVDDMASSGVDGIDTAGSKGDANNPESTQGNARGSSAASDGSAPGGSKNDGKNDGSAAGGPASAAQNAARGETLSEVGVEEGGESADPELSGNEVAGQYLDQLQRLRAEFDNFRKRTARDKEQWWRQAKADLLTELLPVLDDRSRAEAFSEAPDADGLQQILKKLVETLTQLGLEAMETEPGTAFDPELHEAFMTSPSQDVEEGRIVITMEPGYTFEGEILRRAKVSVSSGPATDDG